MRPPNDPPPARPPALADTPPPAAWLCSAATGCHAVHLVVADRFFPRLLGLMGRRGLPLGRGLLLRHCASVHTAFMRFPIDVAYLDDAGTVLKVVSHLRPWRCSALAWPPQRAPDTRPVHTLELPAGTLKAWGVTEGDALAHRSFPCGLRRVQGKPRPQRGVAMIEFAVVAPAITLLGLSVLQYAMLFHAKSLVNHASFMAAREGSVAHADLDKVRQSYLKALIPLYGAGKDEASRAQALVKVGEDLLDPEHPALRVELLNPTRESFDDWNDPQLQKALNTGQKRVIPNRGLAHKLGDAKVAAALGKNADAVDHKGAQVKKRSGQSLADANLIKLRITHGYQPKVPLMGALYTTFLRWTDPNTDAFHTALIALGRIPVVSDVTLHMQSDAIESDHPVSSPGEGNHGVPADPGSPPNPSEPPPQCADAGCRDPQPKATDPEGSSGECLGEACGACPMFNAQESLTADGLFPSDKSSMADLLPEGRRQLDDLVAYAQAHAPTSLTITGHTDSMGTAAHNQPLSLNRAKAVRDYLRQKGLPDVPVTVLGKGSADPVKDPALCDRLGRAEQIDCLQPNRRVVVLMQGVS